MVAFHLDADALTVDYVLAMIRQSELTSLDHDEITHLVLASGGNRARLILELETRASDLGDYAGQLQREFHVLAGLLRQRSDE